MKRMAWMIGVVATLTAALGAADMQLFDARPRWVVEPGVFEIRVGSSSADVRLKGRFEIKE